MESSLKSKLQVKPVAASYAEKPVVRQLMLNIGERLDNVVFSLQKGFILRFILGQSLDNLDVRLFTNHLFFEPEVEDSACMYELVWEKRKSSAFWFLFDSMVTYSDMQITVAGPFAYFFTIDGSNRLENAAGGGYFTVEPELVVGIPPKHIPLNGIVCQTVLSKNLGPLSGWLKRLMVAKNSGYNAVHFTPIQELGDSQSAYALRDMFQLNPSFGSSVSIDDVAEVVKYLDSECGMLSFTDLVLNHAANESAWLAEHPQCVYNLVNTPHLRPAFLLDCTLARFSAEVADGQWTAAGLPPNVHSENHLQLIRHVLSERIDMLKLWEFFQVDIESSLASTAKLHHECLPSSKDTHGSLIIQQDGRFRRFGSTVDIGLMASILCHKTKNLSNHATATTAAAVDDDADGNHLCLDELRSRLERLNADAEVVVRGHLNHAVNNIIHSVWQRFINVHGERAAAVTVSQPLMNRYFRLPVYYRGSKLEDDEALMNCDDAVHCWTHSGWVCDDVVDPLSNFAEPPSNVYLRRELNSWTDSVKLRYGRSPSDCPALWQRAADYAAMTARLFHGIRLDNCHSTPAHVAEHVLAAARRARRDLFVFAELHTGAAGGDAAAARLANRLGLNAVLSVALHDDAPWKLADRVAASSPASVGALVPRRVDWLLGRQRVAVMLLDQSHDDASALERRSPEDPLPSAAVVSAAASPVGSSRGYDELVPHTISVIDERRLYRAWNSASGVHDLCKDADDDPVSTVNERTALIASKRVLNELHIEAARAGLDHVSSEMLTADIVAATRRRHGNRYSLMTVAHTAFHHRNSDTASATAADVISLQVPGRVDHIYLEASVADASTANYCEHDQLLVGLPDYRVDVRRNILPSESRLIRVAAERNSDYVELIGFLPGSVVVFGVDLDSPAAVTLDELVDCFDRWIWCQEPLPLHSSDALDAEKLLSSVVEAAEIVESQRDGDQQRTLELADCTDVVQTGSELFVHLLTVVCQLSHADARRVLFDDDLERRTDGRGFAVYHVPGLGDLPHCGLAGVAPLFVELRRLGVDPGRHPLGVNLRQGDWMLDYVAARLAARSDTRYLADWFSAVFQLVKTLPRCLVPCYFEAVVSAVHLLVTTKL